MASISTYVRDYGNKTFFEEPFNEIDNVVFSSLIYLNYEDIVPENRKYIRLEEAGIKYLEKYSLNVISLEEDDKLNENTISEVKKLIRNGQIKYIYSASETTNDTCKNLIDNYGVELVTINTMESIDGNVSNSNENYVTIMNNNLELFNKELYK